MSKELEALNDIRKVLEEAYKFPLNLTPQYKFIYEALKRNESMEPTVCDGDYNYIYYCPKCDSTIMVERDGFRKHLFNYCGFCGQKLDWGEK